MDFEKLSDIFKALGDPTRLRIIALLNQRECCSCELVPIFGISQPSISKHLSRLKVSGLINERRKGQWVFYSLNRERFEEIGFLLNQLPDMSETFKELEAKGLLVTCCD